MCFAVDTDDGVLVFDTGMHEACCGPDPAAHFGAMLTLFEIRCPRHALVDERLRQAGYTVDEVRWVVNSHLHFDHAGRNAAFPAATQYVRTPRVGLGVGAVEEDDERCAGRRSRRDDRRSVGLRRHVRPHARPAIGLDARAHAGPSGPARRRSPTVAASSAPVTRPTRCRRSSSTTPTGRPTDLEQSVASLHTPDLPRRRDPDRPRHRPVARSHRSVLDPLRLSRRALRSLTPRSGACGAKR